MRWLITGGCGFLGSNLASEILRRDLGVVALLDNLSRTGSDRNLAWLRSLGSPTHFPLDVRVAADVDEAIRTFEPDVVFHLAGQVAMTTSLENPRLDFETNAMGTFNVLDALRRLSPRTVLLYSSTNKVYGDLEHLAYREDATRWVAVDYLSGFPTSLPLAFRTPYGTSKGSADQYVLDWSRTYGLRTAVFRHSSMYGSRQFGSYDQGWIAWFCACALRRAGGDPEPFTISGDGKQVRDLLHSEDMISLYFQAAESIDRIVGRAFNVGGGMQNSLSLLELLSTLERKLGVRLEYRRLPPRSSDQKVFVADVSELEAALGWRPKVGREEGLDRMLDWTREVG